MKLTRNELLEALAQYGYHLHRPARGYKPSDVLFNLVEEDDVRLLEGFPVAFKNMLDQEGGLNWNAYKDRLKKELSDDEKEKFLNLLLLTYLLFRLYGEDQAKLDETESVLVTVSDDWRLSLKAVENKFNHSDSVYLNDKVFLSVERLKNQFRNYLVHFRNQPGSESKMSMELEVQLSEFFTQKQKELLKKRLSGEALTKTEKEYFYRVVSKRLRALGSDTVHSFAKSAVSRR